MRLQQLAIMYYVLRLLIVVVDLVLIFRYSHIKMGCGWRAGLGTVRVLAGERDAN